MKKAELSRSFKGFSKIEALKRINLHDNQLMFYSEPSSANGTPTNSTPKKLKLEPITKEFFLAKKPTADSPSHEATSSNKTSVFIIKSSIKKTAQYFKDHCDSDSDNGTPTGADQKGHRRSKFARSTFGDADEKKQTDESTAATSKSSNTHEVLTDPKEEMTFTSMANKNTPDPISNKFVIKSQNPDLTPTEQKENKPSSASKPNDSVKKMRESAFLRKGVKLINNPNLLDYNSDGEAKKSLLPKNGPVMPYKWLYFAPNFNFEKFKRHLIMVYKGLIYSTKSLKSPSDKFISTKQLIVPDPPTKKQKTLILDLDETLIHCCSPKEGPDVVLQAVVGNGDTMKIPLKIRPYLRDFFNKVSPVYEIIIFTASSAPYAKTVLSHIDPERKYINFMLTREHCMETKNGFFIKDLRILKNRDLKDMIIVDNLVHSFGFQLENGVPIIEFLNDPADMELRYLADYLLKGHYIPDLRDYNRDKLRLIEMSQRRFEDIENEIKF